ncbi:hypothetical protein H5410_046040 [Solanum commersonii]|uniref:Uncharacterized protein n=1 Tax=Solanum commersonii TaxID=4109 RepID=A0A9J5XEI0_SOLCO|nr:hypothetical protein H5410_046040 [Solanum commersonii]
MIPYSHNVSWLKASKSDATLTLTRKNTMHAFTHRFGRFFDQHLFQLTQDQKGLLRLVMGLSAKFLPKKGKAQGVFKRGSHTHKVGHKKASVAMFASTILSKSCAALKACIALTNPRAHEGTTGSM